MKWVDKTVKERMERKKHENNNQNKRRVTRIDRARGPTFTTTHQKVTTAISVKNNVNKSN